jgi:hypothetical protein
VTGVDASEHVFAAVKFAPTVHRFITKVAEFVPLMESVNPLIATEPKFLT